MCSLWCMMNAVNCGTQALPTIAITRKAASISPKTIPLLYEYRFRYIAIGIGQIKYASQYADSVNEASKVFSSQVFINCRIIVGSKLLLIAQRKNRQKTRIKGMFFFINLLVDKEFP